LKLYSLIAVLLLVFAVACGGDDDDGGSGSSSADSGSQAAAPTENDDDEPEDESSDDSDSSGDSDGSSGGASSSGLEAGKASVTIGDEIFEFDVTCVVSFGAVGGGGQASDGSDVDLGIDIRPAEFGPSNLRVTDDRETVRRVFSANEEDAAEVPGVQPGQSQVDDFTIDGGMASGTATFIDTWALTLGESAEPVQGSFAMNCAE